MDLIDKKGYLKSALRYIEKDITSDRNLKKLAEKAGISEVSIKNLSVSLKIFLKNIFLLFYKRK